MERQKQSKQTKTERAHHPSACLTRMIKEVPPPEMKRILSNNMKTYKSIKLNSKGKYVI